MTNPFDSTRKKSSAVIEHQNHFLILVKGADNVIWESLCSGGQPFEDFIAKKLLDYSNLGLRTLCMGFRLVSKEEFNRLKNNLDEAKAKGGEENVQEAL